MTRSGEKPEIRAVFFDIGNVLLRFNAKAFVMHLSRATGRSPLAIAGYFWIERLSDKLERGHLTPAEFFKLFRAKLGYKENWSAFCDAWCDFTLNPETEEIMNAVRLRRKVYLLSNTNELHYDFIRRNYSFPRRVHGALLSYRLGLRKPEPEIYRAALLKARAAAAETVFIDDLKENVAAARRLGINAIRYTSPADLRASLGALGVAV
ncbi:MAG TPA: HAD family phosphatase [Elusimicrobiota bacterium]|nr:HAD family phosphatase [Elusimicrobiota bacterium]